MRRMLIAHHLLRLRSRHRLPGNPARQFDPLILRIQFPEQKSKVLECQLSLLPARPPSLQCKLFVGSALFPLRLYDTIRTIQMVVFLFFGAVEEQTPSKSKHPKSGGGHFFMGQERHLRTAAKPTDTIAVSRLARPPTPSGTSLTVRRPANVIVRGPVCVTS